LGENQWGARKNTGVFFVALWGNYWKLGGDAVGLIWRAGGDLVHFRFTRLVVRSKMTLVVNAGNGIIQLFFPLTMHNPFCTLCC